MLKINLEHVDDLACGAAILGAGGGGDPYVGSLMLRQAIRDNGTIDLIDVDDLGDEEFAVPFAMMGAPTVLVEKLPSEQEMLTALRAMERYCGKRAKAILCAEIGGINALLPLVLAARSNLPAVDGDGMGRALPQLQMTTYHIHGVSPAPIVVTDEYSNTVIIESASALHAERLSRHLAVAMGGSCSICLYSMRGRDAKSSIVRSTISLALGLGRTIREARSTSQDPFEAVLTYLRLTPYYQHCRMLFAGKVVDVVRETKSGWTLGRLILEGTGLHSGRQAEVQFQNEHLLARSGMATLAIVPDLIAVLDGETAEPITTEALKYGQRVKLLGMSAAPIMRSARALATFGPQVFGLTEPFTPIEVLHSRASA